jgi:shikimate dehydrogenase
VVSGFEPGRLSPAARVADVAYRPAETLLLKAVRGVGLTAWNGLGMLVHQGAASFTLWTGVEAPVEAMARAVGYTELASG